MTRAINSFFETPRLILYAAAPIVIDYGIYKIASSKMWKYAGSTVAGLAAIFVLSRYSSRTRIMTLTYLFYKVALFWRDIPVKPSQPRGWHPEDSRLADLQLPFEADVDSKKNFHHFCYDLQIPYPHRWTNWKDLNDWANDPANLDQARNNWKNHWNNALVFIQGAAQEFEQIREELWRKFDSARSEEHRHQQIAAFLQKDNSLKNHSSSYSGYGGSSPHNLLGYYRFIRSMSYQLAYRDVETKCYAATYQLTLSFADLLHFSTEGTPQHQIREIYNQAIEKWRPVMEYLPPNSPYHDWLQKDEVTSRFNLNPPPLPT